MRTSQIAVNPIYARLTRNARPPSLRLTLWIALVLASGVAVWALDTSLTLLNQGNPLHLIDFSNRYPLPLFYVPFGPWAAAVTAVLITHRDSAGEDFVLLRMTAVPPKTVVLGYMAAALFRLRLPLALLVVMLPFELVGRFDAQAALTAFPGIPQLVLVPGIPLAGRFAGAFIGGTLISLFFQVWLWGMVALGAAFGVYAAFRFRRLGAALLATLVVPVVVVGLAFVIGVVSILNIALLQMALWLAPCLLIPVAVARAATAYDLLGPA